MTQCVLLSHGGLADEYLKTIKMIVGEVSTIKSFGIKIDENVEEFQKKVTEYIEYLDDDVVVFCDLLGGSPMLSLASVIQNFSKNIAVITGMNLGMVIEFLLQSNNLEFDYLVHITKDSGVNGIKVIKKEDVCQ